MSADDITFEIDQPTSTCNTDIDIDNLIKHMISQNSKYKIYECDAREYLSQLNAVERAMCNVAKEQLGDAFSIIKSTRFIAWRKRKSKDDVK